MGDLGNFFRFRVYFYQLIRLRAIFVILQVSGYFGHFLGFKGYFSYFLDFEGILIIFWCLSYFGQFLRFRVILAILKVSVVFWSFFQFWWYFGHFIGFHGYFVGVSMFDPTREHDTNPTRVFPGQGWALMGLGHKRVDPKVTR